MELALFLFPSWGLKIGYGTRRLEGLTELHWSRERVPLGAFKEVKHMLF